MSGKGDKRRAPQVLPQVIRSNWDKIFPKKTVTVCGFCLEEVGGVGAGDESLDYCHECDQIVEGNTVELEHD